MPTPKLKPFELALVQMAVVGGARDANLARVEQHIAAAAQHGAQIVLLPECLDLGWTHPSAATLATPIPGGEAAQRLANAARMHRVHVCAGITERDGDRVYNTAILLDADGNLLGKHRKLNELDIGHDCYAQGHSLNVVETPFGAIGLMICADAFARDLVLGRSLGFMGADLILSPCAWAVEATHDNLAKPYGALWRDSYGPVAKAYSLWIAGVSNVGPITGGPWACRNCIGCSMLVGPDGEVAAQAPYGVDAETILYADITPVPRPARGCDWETHWAST